MRRFVVMALVMACHLAKAADWEPLPPLPEPNGGFACGNLNGGIVIAGGTKWVNDTKVWLDKIWWFDPQTLQWSPKGTLPHPLGYAVCGPSKGGLIMAGGFDGSKASNDVWLLDSSFKLKTVGTVQGVAIAQGGVCGDDLIIMGGTSDPAKITDLVSTTQHLKLGDRVGSLIKSPSTIGVGSGASAVIGDHLYVFGGVRSDVSNVAEAWVLEVKTKAWQALPPYPVPTRGHDAVALDDHRIYIAGGYSEDFTDKAFVYDTKAKTYTPSLPLPIPNCGKLIVCDGWLYLLGGEPAKKVRTDKCWRIRLAEITGS